MPRNVAKPLSARDHLRQRMNATSLRDLGSEGIVEVAYTKRDGKASASTGKVMNFSGRPGYDTGSVTIDDPNKGARTINLHNIVSIKEIKVN